MQYIEFAETKTFANNDVSFQLDFFRNEAYQCGLSGNYTFLVVNPRGNPDVSAPLWVYLHGGGNGYWDEDGVYHSTVGQTEDSYNHEEDSAKLLWHLRVRMQDPHGQIEDQTLKRRIDEGYRLLIVSYCDHDLYSGLGTPYPNHPTNPDAQVNGLQATMAAVDFTSANYPTTHIWAHGTSAGSAGAWALASSYAAEGKPITGIIADSGIFTPKQVDFQSLMAQGEGLREATWETSGITEKIGFYADENIPAWPEGQIANQDFRAVPSLFIAGDADPFCFGHVEAIPEAKAAGLSNCGYHFSALSQAIANQVNSPHEFHLLPGTGHVPTNDPGPANDIVDAFIEKILAALSVLEPERDLGATLECPWDESDLTLRTFIVVGQSGRVSQ